jgi:hypothetical protein
VSDPPDFGADDDEAGADELDDPQPERMTIAITARMAGAARKVVRL